MMGQYVRIEPGIYRRFRTSAAGPAPDQSLYIKFYDPAKKYSVYECTGSGDIRIARKKFRERETSKDNGESLVSRTVVKTTMKDLFQLLTDDYQKNKRKSARTLEYRLKKLQLFFGHRRAVNVTTEVIEQYKTLREKQGAAAGTINHELNAIRKGVPTWKENQEIALFT